MMGGLCVSLLGDVVPSPACGPEIRDGREFISEKVCYQS